MNTNNELKMFYSQRFNTNHPSCYINNIDKVEFVVTQREYKVPPRYIKDGIIMVFKEPIWFNDEFRLIPCYTDFAINKDGQVLSIKTDTILSQYDSNGYIHCSLGDDSVPIHRLVGLVWVINPDWQTKHIVNHIDGIKSNNKIYNLEWCDYSENNKHAARNGLTEGVISARSRDINTGEIKHFSTLGEISEFLNSKQTITASRFINRNPNRLFNNQYEVRIDGDDRPWYYAQSITPERSKAAVVKCVEVLHVEDNIISKHESMRATARDLDIDYGVIYNAITHNDGRVVNGKVYRFISGKPWTVNHDYKVKPISIKACNDDDVIIFKSLKETARYFNCDRSKIKTRIRDNKPLDGWKLSYTDCSPNTQ